MFVSVTSPIRVGLSPFFSNSEKTSSLDACEQITVMPIPQLKVLSISSWLTLPAEESHLKTGGKFQVDKSIFIPCPSPKALKIFSVKPPPVM